VVAGAVGPAVRDARPALGLGRHGLEHGLEALPRLDGAARPERGTVPRALLAARDAHAHEVDAELGQVGLAPPRLLKVRVAAVDDDVALVEDGLELLEHR